MANEISALVGASTTGNVALVVNPSNKAQAWDVVAGAWAAKDPADTDQQIALGSAVSEGGVYESQYANLPAALDATEEYELWFYDASGNWIGNKLYRGSSVADTLASIAVTDAVVDSISTKVDTVDTVADTINTKLGTPSSSIAADIAAIEAGTTEPRVNRKPSMTLLLAHRRDGVYVCGGRIRIRPGTFDVKQAIGVDCTPYFGQGVNVRTVGTPVVSGGSITATALGPRDELGMVQLGGTATASEEVTVDVPLTMETNDQFTARFIIEVGSE